MTSCPVLNAFFLDRFGSKIKKEQPVGGGCINEARRVELESGEAFFVKKNHISLLDMFEKEAMGLRLLAQGTPEIIIPETHGVIKKEETGEAFLVLDFVEELPPSSSFDQSFGHYLAELHRNKADSYGLNHDNYIGKLPQKNEKKNDWPTFFMECRIEPQISLAQKSGFFSSRTMQSLKNFYRRLPGLFPEEPPSLLHGDLWSGNYLCGPGHRPVLIDPAVYYGHREAELAFTTLFGGFGHGFYQGYEESWPLAPGFSERKSIYNLYPLLVHVNLFGGAYVAQAEAVLRRF